MVFLPPLRDFFPPTPETYIFLAGIYRFTPLVSFSSFPFSFILSLFLDVYCGCSSLDLRIEGQKAPSVKTESLSRETEIDEGQHKPSKYVCVPLFISMLCRVMPDRTRCKLIDEILKPGVSGGR